MLFLIVSILYFTVPASFSLPFTYYLMSSIILLVGIFKFVLLDSKTREKVDYYLDLTESILSILISILAINFGLKYIALSIVLGILYLIIPVTRLVYAKIKLNQLFIDSYKFLAGFVLIASNPIYAFWIKYVLGVMYLVFSIMILVTKLIHLHQYKKEGVYYE